MGTSVLRVAIFERSPFVVKRVSPDGYEWSGFCVDLLDDLASILDFQYELYETPDNTAGNELPDGNWTGVIGEIVNEKSDLAVSALTITSLREKVVDFTKPFMEYGNVLVMRRPSFEDRDILAFTHPFHWQVWLCIVTCMFTVGILLFLTSRLRLKMNAGDKHANNDRSFNLRNSLWFVYWSLMRKGGEPPPRSMSTRIIAGFWWLFVLIVVSTYTANLTAFLTVKRLKHPVTSLEDLASQTKVKYGIVSHGSLFDFFKVQEGTSSIYERLWYGMKANPQESFVSNVDEGMTRARGGGYAFITEATYFVYEAMRDPDCQLSMVGAPFVYGGYGIATRNGSHWTEKLTVGILQLRELGRINTLRDRWWPRSGCSLDGSNPSADASGLTLSDLKGVFYLLFCGLVLGVVAALVEIYWQKKHSIEEVHGNPESLQNGTAMVAGERQSHQCADHTLLRQCLQLVELGEIRVVIQKVDPTSSSRTGDPS